MSRGISWRQQRMLDSIADGWQRQGDEIVAWRDIDDGPRNGDIPANDILCAQGAWNSEQYIRRALRSLERRGLVTLGRYVFFPEGIDGNIVWRAAHPDRHIPGDTRIMVGASLTPLGRSLVAKAA